MEILRQTADRLGLPIEIDPAIALINAVWEAEGNLAFYRAQVQQLQSLTDTEFGPGGASKEVANVLVVLYHEAERWRARVAADALKAGVEERRVRMAEADAARILGAQVAALIAIGVGDRLEEFRVAFVDALRADDQPLSLSSTGTG